MTRRRPEDCQTMTELRAAIDTLDAALVDLLAERVRCIDRAVALKAEAGLAARIPERAREVIGNARRLAGARGLDADLAGRLWHEIVEWSIAREEKSLGPGGHEGMAGDAKGGDGG